MQRLSTYARAAAAASAALAAIVLLDWWTGDPLHHRLSERYPPMMPHTAAALIAAAGLVWLAARRSAPRVRQGLSFLVLLFPLAAILVIAGATAALFGTSLGFALLLATGMALAAIIVVATARSLHQVHAGRAAALESSRRSEALFRAIIAQAPEGVFVADPSGRSLDVNEAGARMLGFSREAIVGKTILDLVRPEDRDRFQAHRERLLAGEVETSEWLLRRRDGRLVPTEVSATILPDGRWLGFTRDVTERCKADEALRAWRDRERELREELEAVAQASLVVTESVALLPHAGLEAVLRSIADQARRVTRAEHAALGIGNGDGPFSLWVSVGQPCAPRPAHGLAAIARAGRTARGAGEQVARILRLPPPFHPRVRSFLSVPLGYRGRVLGTVFLCNKHGGPEFTDRDQRLAEMLAARVGVAIEIARLYESEARQRTWLTAVIDQLPEALLLIGADGRVVTANRPAMALAGDAEGVDPYGNALLWSVRRPDGSPMPYEEYPLVRAFRHSEEVRGAEAALLVRGSLVPILANAAPVRDEKGQLVGAMVLFQDIRERKELERLREEWTSIVAHDLRQPLQVLDLAADALARAHRGSLADGERRALERIRASTQRLARMIDDLADVSCIEARRLSMERRVVDISALAAEVVARTQKPGARQARLVLRGDSRAWADPGRVEQVLQNLLSNAAKHGAPGAEIRVEVQPRGAQVEVSVANRGPGIPSEELPALFDRFARARAARASGAPGLGLGLYIARGIVEAHGGRIWAESVPGGETVFCFTLPRADAGGCPEAPALQ